MEPIAATLNPGDTGLQVANLQDALRLLLDRGVIRSVEPPNNPTAEELAKLGQGLARERARSVYGNATQRLVLYVQLQQGLGDGLGGGVEEKTAAQLNQILKRLGAFDAAPDWVVRGTVRHGDGRPLAQGTVRVMDRDLRSEQELGRIAIENGRYEILYTRDQFARAEKRSADLIVRVFGPDEREITSSPTLYNAPPIADVDVTIPTGMFELPSLFESINLAIGPLLGGLTSADLDETADHADLTFLAGETGFSQDVLARFVLAHRLTARGIAAEFWFALLGDTAFLAQRTEGLAATLSAIVQRLPSISDERLLKSLTNSLTLKEIAAPLHDRIPEWVKAFRALVAGLAVDEPAAAPFAKAALDDLGVNRDRQVRFVALLAEHGGLTPTMLDQLGGDFSKAEIANLRTAFQLRHVTGGSFSTVKAIKNAFEVRQPSQVRELARRHEDEWTTLIESREAAGEIDVPIALAKDAQRLGFPAARVYAKAIAQKVREAFPTTAFAGSLERAMRGGRAAGLTHAEGVSRVLARHPDFELLRTPLDEFLDQQLHPELRDLAKQPEFRLELKAIQRVFKIAPTFEATSALLGDQIHSGQQIYRLGEAEFVSRYAMREGFTAETARATWMRAADTYAAVLTMVGDLKSLSDLHLPRAIGHKKGAVAKFPNWNNLFQGGDLCECEHCRSVLGPAAYFADLLVFLRDRAARTGSVKDVLLKRRADLGYLELNCGNGSVALPYIDVVNEVLEAAITQGQSDVELANFAAMPMDSATANVAVVKALKAAQLDPGAAFSLSQVNPGDRDRWVVHGDAATYLLKKKTTPNFFAELLRNTKASAAELRAYPQYADAVAYRALRRTRYPMSLPFDLFSEEVRASFKKVNMQRWALMEQLRDDDPPHDPRDVQIAAEYFGIGVDNDPMAAIDELRVMLVPETTTAGQQTLWGESGSAAWLNTLSTVSTFLQKTGLEYLELLALLDLPFINPARDMEVSTSDDPGCDTTRQKISALDEAKLDRIHRFLRLWRKLGDWRMWELDLAIRHPAVGAKQLDDKCLVRLFHLSEVRKRLGANVTVEQVLALFGDLNTETRFTKPFEKRDDGLYQALFQNRKLTQPLEAAFDVRNVTVQPPTAAKISQHRLTLLAALRIQESDLAVLTGLTRASDGQLYITDDLTLANLSFLWRHAWLSRQLQWKLDEWRVMLKMFNEDRAGFGDPRQARDFLNFVDLVKAAGLTPDELSWLLGADRSAKSAAKEADAATFLRALRGTLQSIRTEYDPARFDVLMVSPPTSIEPLEALLASLLTKLGRTDQEARSFVAAIRGRVALESPVDGLPAAFAFPAAFIGAPGNVPIAHDAAARVLRFTGVMSDTQRIALLDDTASSATSLRAAAQLTATVQLPAGFTFPASITGAPNNVPILYDQPTTTIQFSGLMTDAQRRLLLTDASFAAGIRADAAYQQAIVDLYQQSLRIGSIYRLAIDDLYQQSLTAGERYVVTEVEAAAPIALPANLPSLPVRSDLARGTVRFIGIMTATDRTALEAVPGNSTAIVGELFNQPRLAMKFFEPLFMTRLDALPPAVDFKGHLPATLAARMTFNERERQLEYSSVLTADDLSSLQALAPGGGSIDIAYRTALADLASQAQSIVPPDPRIWLVDADLDPSQVASNTVDKRLAIAVRKALGYLSDKLSVEAVIASASERLAIDEGVTRRLVAGYALLPDTVLGHLLGSFTRTFGVVDAATLPDTFKAWYWTVRAATLLKKWKVTVEELDAIIKLTPNAALLDLGTLPLDDGSALAPLDRFARLNRLIELRDALPESHITLLEVLTRINDRRYTANAAVNGLTAGFSFPAAITGAPNTIQIRYDEPNGRLRVEGLLSASQARALLQDASLPAAVTGNASYQQAIAALVDALNRAFASDVETLTGTWPTADVQAAVGAIGVTVPSDPLRMETWDRLRKIFGFARSLNLGVNSLMAFAAPTMSEREVAVLKDALRSKLGVDTWLTLCNEIQDVLRERKRNALAAYLLAQPRPADAPTAKWENTNDLYAYYLLDVEMGSCQLTSRLVQGSGSIQLFVQRCFMGLEPLVFVNEDLSNGDTAWRWWTWMRKYRVWEANRKIFLWPENWIEPELRRDKSEIFGELENELIQNEMDQSTAEAAVLGYLEKLDAIARLEVAGFFQEDRGYDTIVHVFARTPGGDPRQYYYRRFEHRMQYLGEWTPWERMELDIQGDYLIPTVIGGRLFVFWPVFTEVQDEAGNSSVSVPSTGAQKFTPDKPKKRLRMQMAVSEYRQGGWTPKRVSTTAAESDPSDPYTGEIDTRYFGFFPIDRTEAGGAFVIRYQGQALDASSVRSSHRTGRTPTRVNGNAALYGEIELSGCRGVYDVVFHAADGSFEYADHIVPVEKDAVAANQWRPFSEGLRWIERDVRYDLPTNTYRDDLTVDNFLATTFTTSLLARTPGLFAVSPAFHGSYFDRLRFMASPSHEYVGAGLPFFYGDKSRTYFVLTAGMRTLWDGSLRRLYYPELKTDIRIAELMFQGDVDTWVEGFIANLTSAERDDMSQWIAFSRQTTLQPPYSDAQLIALVKQMPKLATRRYLKAQADSDLQDTRFHFKNFYHPLTCEFGRIANDPLRGIPALYRRETQMLESAFRFYNTYGPAAAVIDPTGNPQDPHSPFYPRETVDFDRDAAYASYNWELFFHVPLLIANSLSRNQRFEEARNWYHFIFNPMGVAASQPAGSVMSKFWITKPFFETTDPQYLEERIDLLMRLLAGDRTAPGFGQSGFDLEGAVYDWRVYPFEPHRIASYRTVAYQKTVVIKYIQNLVAWGDYLFRQDSMESINEATQLYIMAAEILGPRPKIIPPRQKPPVETFNELEYKFDAFSNALVEAENLVPFQPGTGRIAKNQPPLPMLYFCIPPNEQLLAQWDIVEDRLYKVRHCMNIEGVARQLALFEPPIDPGALVKAVAGGLDIGAALADINAPMPLYRFNVLLQKANEVCNDVKALGSALLNALEKKDNEAVALLRQTQEIQLQQAVQSVRKSQIDEAKKNADGLRKNKELVTIRRDYYQNIERVSAGEQLHQRKLKEAHAMQQVAQIINIAASIAHIVPSFDVGGAGAGGSPRAGVSFGGPNVGNSLQATAGAFNFVADIHTFDANQASIDAGYDRRWDDWKFQEQLANKELEQLDESIAAAEVRSAIAEKELENHNLQIENAKATDAFMRSKYTNYELYQWQVGQISSVYFQSYKLAYDLAKRAERCFRFELGLQDSNYIQFGYWDSLKKGLLSGEKLQYDLRRLETAYLEQNRREFELTKHVSLGLLDPLALVKLRETGRCFVNLPEEIFDLDFPGHYFRRIKSVSVTLPCVTGPYTTISCTLRLLKNSIRINTANGDNGYPRNTDDEGLPVDDSRFIEHNIPVKAVAVSTAQNDSGVFELSFRDERYLPFEGAGVISQWSIELFNDQDSSDFGRSLRQFDYSTISDAILHVKYTAREDAGPFKAKAIANLRNYFPKVGAAPSVRLLNLRQEFPSQWHRFQHPSDPAVGKVLELEMAAKLFPFRDSGKALKINTLVLLARCSKPDPYSIEMTPSLPSTTLTLVQLAKYGGLHAVETGSALNPLGLTLTFGDKWVFKMTGTNGALQPNEVEDMFLVFGYEWDS